LINKFEILKLEI